MDIEYTFEDETDRFEIESFEELIKLGVSAIIQPGGSVNDEEVIKKADEAGVVMVFTETRYFKH